MAPYQEPENSDDEEEEQEGQEIENEIMASSEADVTPEAPKEEAGASDLEQFMVGASDPSPNKP